MNSGNAWPILPNWVDGSHRLMFHFENYNVAVSFRHFKLDAVNPVLILLTPWGAYLAVLVFKTCLLCLSRCLKAQEIPSVSFKEELYEFKSLLTSLTSVPREFSTRIWNIPWRSLGIRDFQ